MGVLRTFGDPGGPALTRQTVQSSQWSATGATDVLGSGLLNVSHTSFVRSGIGVNGTLAGHTTSGSSADNDQTRSASQSCSLDALPRLSLKFALPTDLTNNRFFAGLANAVNPSSIDLITNAIGLQKRAGDTNWFFYTSDASSGATRVDTTVAASNVPLIVEVDVASASSVTVRLLDIDGVELATTTFTSNLVPGSTGLFSVQSIHETAAVVSQMDSFFASLELRR